MQAHDNGPAALAHPGEAANEEFLLLQDAPASPGWNAYEVWRVRVKAVYDARGQTALPTHLEPSNSLAAPSGIGAFIGGCWKT